MLEAVGGVQLGDVRFGPCFVGRQRIRKTTIVCDVPGAHEVQCTLPGFR